MDSIDCAFDKNNVFMCYLCNKNKENTNDVYARI